MRLVITIILSFISLSAQSTPQLKPAIQQAIPYQEIINVNQYWLSEKLDGIRGYWNGKQLFTRQGNKIHSPEWFTDNWPDYALDGELWVQRDYFQQTLSCVRKKTADKTCWQYVHFMIFDLPDHGGSFTQRVAAMQRLTKKLNSPYLSMIKQFKLATLKQLNQHLDKVVKNKGEGLMLHHSNAFYSAGRAAHIMKLKKHHDAEATVMAHIEGKGKYKGALGAIQVKTNEGITFKIGSGFSDKERYNPPAIGSIITFKYNGKTQAGIPRFARFYRVRQKRVETFN